MLSLGEALAHELRGTGVTVTTLCPGPMHTGFAAASGGEDTRLYRDRRGLMDPATAARQAYAALKAGRRVSIPGAGNRLTAAWLRFAPRALLLAPLASLLRHGKQMVPARRPSGE